MTHLVIAIGGAGHGFSAGLFVVEALAETRSAGFDTRTSSAHFSLYLETILLTSYSDGRAAMDRRPRDHRRAVEQPIFAQQTRLLLRVRQTCNSAEI